MQESTINSNNFIVKNNPNLLHIYQHLMFRWNVCNTDLTCLALLVCTSHPLAIHGMAPSYLSNLICIRSSSRYSLRNNDTIFLERPKGVMRTTLGARSFHASAPALWNSLPAHIRTIDSLALFKKSLKTYLFELAF